MKIAICDDDTTFIDKVKKDILKMQTLDNEFSFYEFTCGEDFIADFSKKKYDLVILDIEMKHLNGLQTAEYLRKIDEDVMMIFLTSYDKFACQGYEVKAFRYILKNQPEPIYIKQLHDTIQEFYRNKRYMIVSCNRSEEKLLTTNILYIEVFSHKILIHTFKTDYEEKGKLSDYEKKLSDCLFVRIDKSTLVNVTNIESIRKNEVILKNNKTLYASRNHLENITQSFLKYNRSRWG